MKRRFSACALVLSISGLASADPAADSLKRLTDIQDFLTTKVESKTHSDKVEKEKYNDKTIADTDDSMVIHDVTRRKASLSFQVTSNMSQTLYDVGADGNAILASAKKNDRIQAMVCELIPLKGSVKVNGYCRNLANSRFDPTGWVQIIRDARVENGELVISKASGTLGESFLGTDNYLTTMGESTTRYMIKDGKLNVVMAFKASNIVNPDTFEKIGPVPGAKDETYTYIER